MADPRVPTLLLSLLALTAGLAGCIGDDGGPAEPTEEGAGSQPPGGTAPRDNEIHNAGPGAASGVSITFTSPTELTGEEGGFEPSIAVAPDGTVYVTAATTQRPGAGDRLASWLWYAEADGRSWQHPSSPGQVHEKLVGLEGDIAVDDEGRLYFADINLAGTFLHRWSPDHTWDLSRPVTTTTLVDDRPWLAAHGDGIVYLLLHQKTDLSAPDGLGGQPVVHSQWLYVSDDAGLTWSPGTPLYQGRCYMDASPIDTQTLLGVCQQGNGPDSQASILLSTDRGVSFERVYDLNLEQGAVRLVPGAAIDHAGNLYAALLDDHVETPGTEITWMGDAPGRVRYAVSADDGGSWTEHDITPFEGRFGTMHASAGQPGTMALSFYATTDLEPGEESAWYPYLMLSTDASAEEPTWTIVRLLDEPAGTGSSPPLDFFQNDVGPGNAVHLALQRDLPEDVERDGLARGIPADVLYVRQVSGPNLAE